MGVMSKMLGLRWGLGLLAIGVFLWSAAGVQAQAVVATIPVGAGPARVAANPTTNRIYVTNQFGTCLGHRRDLERGHRHRRGRY